MLRYKPEEEKQNTKDMPDAPAGEHQMKLNDYRPGVETAKWSGDIVEFTDGVHTISEFIDEKSLWKFSRLAKAIGPDAVNHYKQTDREGFSTFNPKEWVGSGVSVIVEDCVRNGQPSTRIKKILPAIAVGTWDTESVAPDLTVNDDPSPPQAGNHKPVKDDEIPF